MAYAFVALKYLVPIERIDESTPAHRAYLRTLHEQGTLIASGPFVPREGGGLLVRVADAAALEGLLAADPFRVEKLAEYTIFWWAPGIGLDGLEALPRPPQQG